MDVLLIVTLVLLPLLPPLALFLVVRYGPWPNRWWRGERVIGFAAAVTVGAALLGFFGALLVWPESNLGPPVGMLFAVPAGLAVGIGWGLQRAARRDRDGTP